MDDEQFFQTWTDPRLDRLQALQKAAFSEEEAAFYEGVQRDIRWLRAMAKHHIELLRAYCVWWEEQEE